MSPVAPALPLRNDLPLAGRLIGLVGGGGFVGRHAAQALMAAGARVRIIQRHPRQAWAVKALGNLGQVQFAAADATDATALTRALTGCDGVVHLVAVLKGDFDRLVRQTAANAAAAAKANGIADFVLVSAIGADPDGAAQYARAKAGAEAAVRAALPGATILRPSIIFGRDDQFINRFARMIAALPIVPVAAASAPLQPVFVGDVADAIVAGFDGRAMGADRLFELGGPQRLTMHQLMAWIAQATGRSPLLIDLPDGLVGAMAKVTGWLPGAPITSDQFAMLRAGNVVADGAASLADLGITPTPLAAVAPDWLDAFRRHGRFTLSSARAR